MSYISYLFISSKWPTRTNSPFFKSITSSLFILWSINYFIVKHNKSQNYNENKPIILLPHHHEINYLVLFFFFLAFHLVPISDPRLNTLINTLSFFKFILSSVFILWSMNLFVVKHNKPQHYYENKPIIMLIHQHEINNLVLFFWTFI